MPFPFAEICTLLQRLEDIETNDPPLLNNTKYERARDIIQSWFKSHRRQINELSIDGATALLSALLPEWRTDRVYNIQTQNLYRIICRSMSLRTTSTTILDKYRQPGFGDLATCLGRVLKDLGPPATPRVTLEEVDDMLQELAGGSRFSDPSIRRLPRSSSGMRDETVGHILKRLDPQEGKWFARLILKNFSPVRVNENLVLRNFHFLLPDILRFQKDFHAAATLIKRELHEYPDRPDARSERLLKRQAANKMRPLVGTKVSRPKFDKGRSFDYLLPRLEGKQMVVERKYDGEYCEVHVDLSKHPDPRQCFKIFSKNGKDSTHDRRGLHGTLVESLRLGQKDCRIKRQAILLGELVVFSDKDDMILPFEKIRKHVPRSGVHLGTDEDSQRHEWEHLAIVWFDLLLLDNEVVMNKPVNERRMWLRETYKKRHGRSMSAEWKIIDFSDLARGKGLLLGQFAAANAQRAEGLVLKPMDTPYLSLDLEQEGRFIKLKKDYIDGMGDEADFAVIGASYNAQQAATSGLRSLKWTTFHLGCLTNAEDVIRVGARPCYKHMGTIDKELCIPRPILEAANNVTNFGHQPYQRGEAPQNFDIEFNTPIKMDVVLNEPFVFEVLGSGFEQPSNCSFLMLRHARVKKLHEDRTWRECVTFQELQEQARAAREPVDSESQETRRLIERLESGMKKKFDREKTASPRSRATTTPPGSIVSERMLSPTKPPVRRTINALPTPLPSSGIERVPSSPLRISPTLVRQNSGEKRPRENLAEEQCASKKRRMESAKQTTTKPSASPLTEITNNTDAPSAREVSRTNRHSRALSELTRKVVAVFRPSKTPDSQSTCVSTSPDCEGTKCPFAAATVYLVPCIANTLYITEDLLSTHNIVITRDLTHWDRNSFSHPPLTEEVSESQSHPGMRKIVLVERKRRTAVRNVIQQIQQLNRGQFRERVEIYDWRVLEDCAKHDRGSDLVKRHFVGATMFDDTRKRALFIEEKRGGHDTSKGKQGIGSSRKEAILLT